MVCLENVLKTSLQEVLNMSWRHLEDVFKTSWRRLETPWRGLEDVLKTSWRRFQNVLKMFWRCLENVLKTSWRRLKGIWPRKIYWSWPRRLEDVFFYRRKAKANIFILEDVFWGRRRKTSSRRLHQDECLLGKFVNVNKYN